MKRARRSKWVRGRARMRFAGVALGLLVACGSVTSEAARAQTPLEKAQRDELFWSKRGDPEMVRAIKKARETLDEFLAVAAAPPENTRAHSVKIALTQGDRREFVWIAPFQRKGERFTGTLNNTPRQVLTHKKGDELPFTRDEIVDWTYFEGNRMRGNFTACPLLAKSPPAEQEAFKKSYGLSCDF